MKKISFVALAGILAMTAAGHALAQAPAATPAAPAAATPPTPPSFGAPVPGQCVLDTASAMATSKLGMQASNRLLQLKAQVDAELSGEGEAIQNEYSTLAASQKAQSATAAGKTAWEGKAQAWSQKRDAFQQKVQQRNQEMQYTQQEVMQVVFQKMIPRINDVVTQKSCSMVVQSDGLLHYDAPGPNNESTTFTYVNPAMDITTAVVQKMDAAGEQLPSFDRVHLDQQQAAGQPAPAAGAAKK